MSSLPQRHKSTKIHKDLFYLLRDSNKILKKIFLLSLKPKLPTFIISNKFITFVFNKKQRTFKDNEKRWLA
jgi:hypothetical protein